MKRVGSMTLAAAVAVVITAGYAVAGQTPPAPRKLIAPVRGEAVIQITKPDTKLTTNEVITTIHVKNVSKGPIAGFKVEENWYKGETPMGGDVYRHPRPLPPNEVIVITLKTPRARIVGARNQYQFSHANGTIKATTVAKLDAPKPSN